MLKKTMVTLATAMICQSVLAAGIQANDAYAYPTVGKMTQGGAFVSLTNTDTQDDVLVGASVGKNIADTVELHTHINDNGVMRMREVKDGIPLPAGKTQELKRGAYHVMFFGLKKTLIVGDTFPMTLKFKRNPAQTVTVTVREQQHQHNHDMMHHHHDHEHHHMH